MSGRRADYTNPRQLGTSPRQLGRSPRQLGTNRRASSTADETQRALDARWTVQTVQRALSIMRRRGDACDECGGRSIRDTVRCTCQRVTLADAIEYLSDVDGREP